MPPPATGADEWVTPIFLAVGDSNVKLCEADGRLMAGRVAIIWMSDHTITDGGWILDPDGNESEPYIDVPGINGRSVANLIMAPIGLLAR